MIMLVSIMKNAVLYAIYKYDTETFIAMFCENKYRPQMKCDGKCKLAKMQKEQNEKDAADTLKQLQVETVCNAPARPFSIVHNEFFQVDTAIKGIYYQQSYSFLYVTELIKPPADIPLS